MVSLQRTRALLAEDLDAAILDSHRVCIIWKASLMLLIMVMSWSRPKVTDKTKQLFLSFANQNNSTDIHPTKNQFGLSYPSPIILQSYHCQSCTSSLQDDPQQKLGPIPAHSFLPVSGYLQGEKSERFKVLRTLAFLNKVQSLLLVSPGGKYGTSIDQRFRT
jgi:hypothetical protein